MSALTPILQSVSSTTPFAGKPYVSAAFLVALGRITYDLEHHPEQANSYTLGLAGAIVDQFAVNLPLWLVGNLVVLLFFGLATLELSAAESPELRDIYTQINRIAAPITAAIVNFGLVDGQAAEFFQLLAANAPHELQTLLFGGGVAVASLDPAAPLAQGGLLGGLASILAAAWSALVGVGVWFVAGIRAGVMDAIVDLDDDDSIGITRLFKWAETGWSLVSVILLIVFPVVALGLFLLTLLGLYLARRWFEHRDEGTKRPCPNCATPMYPTALACPNCRQANAQPFDVGILGQVTTRPAKAPSQHRINLIARKRCPVCATRLKEKGAHQKCNACGTITFGDMAELNTYLRALDLRFPKTLGICFLLGLIPLVGLVPGIIYYRVSLVSSLRSYLPLTTGYMTRWGLRMAAVLLVMLQSFPVIGAIMLPLLCTMNYMVYRRVLVASAAKTLVPLRTSPPAGGAVAVLAQPPQQGLGKSFCENCGTPRKAEDRFCTACGKGF